MQRRGLPDLELRRPGDKELPELRRQNPRIQVGEHHEGSGKLYMSHKMLKLRQQFDEAAAAQNHAATAEGAVAADSSAAPGLFAGVRVYVNGYSDTPLQTLEQLLTQHGGR
eukprot:13388-Heterococcus_DN1.PRE.2